MAAPQEFILTLSFDKASCISATAGTLIVGEVFLNRGQFKYSENSFYIHNSQMYDFLLLLKKIAVNMSGEKLPTTSKKKVNAHFLYKAAQFFKLKNLFPFHRNLKRPRQLKAPLSLVRVVEKHPVITEQKLLRQAEENPDRTIY